MNILAIDPGSDRSATCFYDGAQPVCATVDNNELLRDLRGGHLDGDILVVEWIQSYGMPVGAEVFDTCCWIGRFIEAWGTPYERMFRRDVKLHLCNAVNAKDSNIRQAIIDRFPRVGGGKTPQIGVKDKPGPLYGVKGDEWAALGVALTYHHRTTNGATP